MKGGMAQKVLTNDTFNGVLATSANVDIQNISVIPSPATGGIVIQSDGSINVSAGTEPGNYEITYKICDKVIPTNVSDNVVAKVCVTASSISPKECPGVTLNNQAEVDNWEWSGDKNIATGSVPYAPCTKVNGTIVVNSTSGPRWRPVLTNITTVNFPELVEVTGNIQIDGWTFLTDTTLTSNITTINMPKLTSGNVEIGNRGLKFTNLTSLTLSNLTSGNLIVANTGLSTINVPTLTTSAYIFIFNNSSLTSVNVSEIVNVRILILENNPLLTNANFSNLTTISGNIIVRGTGLPNLDGFPSVERVTSQVFIESNPSLTNLDGLANLVVVAGNGAFPGRIFIIENTSLGSSDGILAFCGLKPFFIANPGIEFSTLPSGNGYNPVPQITAADIINGCP